MNGVWLVSYLALWLVVALLLLAVFALARQVGLLHRRMGPAVARTENEGPSIGETIQKVKVVNFEGREMTVGGDRTLPTLFVFLSATCPTCLELAPALRSIWKSDRNSLELVMVTVDSDAHVNRNFIARNKLWGIPLVVSQSLALQLGVFSPPYGVLIDAQGLVLAKGVVNHLEHLESLIDAARLGYPTMESWREAQRSDNAPVTLEKSPDTQHAN
ncbi:MAG TPA: thiol-disulfide isomerase [Blastocatellia bacterium]|nr:thiol-disulfide isomerase [Blastocatellia bacterium]